MIDSRIKQISTNEMITTAFNPFGLILRICGFITIILMIVIYGGWHWHFDFTVIISLTSVGIGMYYLFFSDLVVNFPKKITRDGENIKINNHTFYSSDLNHVAVVRGFGTSGISRSYRVSIVFDYRSVLKKKIEVLTCPTKNSALVHAEILATFLGTHSADDTGRRGRWE